VSEDDEDPTGMRATIAELKATAAALERRADLLEALLPALRDLIENMPEAFTFETVGARELVTCYSCGATLATDAARIHKPGCRLGRAIEQCESLIAKLAAERAAKR
jgi:hypothetical protein